MDEGFVAAEGLDIGLIARARGASRTGSFRTLCATMCGLAIVTTLAVGGFVVPSSMSAGLLTFTTVKRFATLSTLRSLFTTLSDLLLVLLVLALKERIATQLAG